jgi:putative LysE/RhtB family amino acid efflux pump
MQRTLTYGRTAGLGVGMGVAAADALCATIVMSGFKIAADFLTDHADILLAGGGTLMVGLGIRSLRAWHKPAKAGKTEEDAGSLRGWSFVTGFVLTMSNPVAVVLMVSALAYLGYIDMAMDLPHIAFLVAGIFSGSILWWSLLVIAVATVKRQVPAVIVRWTNRLAGLALTLIGIVAISQGLI